MTEQHTADAGTVAIPPGEAHRPVAPGESDDATDLRLAHLLLRSGNALAARVQLETLAGRGRLDVRGLLDLAESRWRTGDLGGAGEAIVPYLEAGGDDPVGDLIAAEATAALGRPGEARKLARRALEGLTLPLDAVFAGLPRSSIWPHDPAAPAQPAGTLFAPAAAHAARGGRIGLTSDVRPAAPAGTGPASMGVASTAGQAAMYGPAPEARPAGDAGSGAQPAAGTFGSTEGQPDPSLWDVRSDAPMPLAAAELDAARAALAAGDQRGAVVHLAIVLRMSPALAPAVLELAGQLPGADFDLLRGDALRLVGHEAAAERAFASAADALRQPPATGSPE